MPVQPIKDILPRYLKSLRPTLRSWVRLMESLAKEWAPARLGAGRDCPWWYQERTSIGFFSASVWGKGGEAIEEYGTDKRTLRIGRRKFKIGKGRGDLMFSVNNRRNKSWFVAEAKQSYPCLTGNGKVLKDCIKEQLRKARKDARNTASFGCARLGLLFLCPYVTNKPPTTKEIRDWIGRVRNIAKREKAALAYTFPAVARDLRDRSSKSKNKHFYPGVALLIRPPRSKK
jgi:hypothetical protein